MRKRHTARPALAPPQAAVLAAQRHGLEVHEGTCPGCQRRCLRTKERHYCANCTREVTTDGLRRLSENRISGCKVYATGRHAHD